MNNFIPKMSINYPMLTFSPNNILSYKQMSPFLTTPSNYMSMYNMFPNLMNYNHQTHSDNNNQIRNMDNIISNNLYNNIATLSDQISYNNPMIPKIDLQLSPINLNLEDLDVNNQIQKK